MLHSPIHRAQLTPSQRLRAIERQARRERFEQSAISRVHEVIELPPDKTQRVELPIVPEPPAIPEPDLVEQWTERQKVIHKPLWFGIVDEVDTPVKKKISIEDIQRVVAAHFELPRRIMFTPTRTARCVLPRQIAMYLAKTMTGRSFPDIGRRFGGRDHTTILYAVRKYEGLVQTDQTIADSIASIKAKLAVRFI